MNILVTGANGQLGNEMRRVTRESKDHYLFTDIWELDITDAAAVEKMVADNEIGMIINCAAYTNVDAAEDDRDNAELLNATAVGNLASAMKTRNGFLIHISTDYVFGGNHHNTPCTEDEQPNPTGVYGLTKLHGEEAIQREGCRHIILRTAWLYSEFGFNFAKRMMNLTRQQSELKVVFDQVGTPTYALDLAEVIFRIVEERKFEGHEGLYHYSDEGVTSWYDFAVAVAEFAGNTTCKIRPCHSEEFPSKVCRPSYSVLDKTKIKTTFVIEIPHWRSSLHRCIEGLM